MNEAITRAAYRPCPECGGQRIIGEVTINRGVFIVTGIMSATTTTPVICTKCGYITFYVADPDKVEKHYLNH